MIKPRLIFDQIFPFIESPEAIVITGMRRTGKTTVLEWLYKQIDSANKLFLDLENPLNRKYFEEDNYGQIKSILEALGIDFSHKAYVFLDEIQLVKNLPSVVKYFIDHYSVKFFLTGSASFYLKNLFSESLAGRKYIFELYPLTFAEFLVFKEVKLKFSEKASLPVAIYEKIAPLMEEYLTFGGFPGVVLKRNIEEKRRALEEILTSYFMMEVNQLADFRKNEALRDLILLLGERVGNKLDYYKMSKELGISRPSVKEYIYFLEGTYFIKLIRPFSRGKDTEIRKMPKVYFCDCGLANHLVRLEEGRVLENAVFQNLRVRGEVNYYQRKSGIEIDFILNQEEAFEVKIKPTVSELKKLKRLAHELGLSQYRIVSKKYTQLDNVIYLFHFNNM